MHDAAVAAVDRVRSGRRDVLEEAVAAVENLAPGVEAGVVDLALLGDLVGVVAALCEEIEDLRDLVHDLEEVEDVEAPGCRFVYQHPVEI